MKKSLMRITFLVVVVSFVCSVRCMDQVQSPLSPFLDRRQIEISFESEMPFDENLRAAVPESINSDQKNVQDKCLNHNYHMCRMISSFFSSQMNYDGIGKVFVGIPTEFDLDDKGSLIYESVLDSKNVPVKIPRQVKSKQVSIVEAYVRAIGYDTCDTVKAGTHRLSWNLPRSVKAYLWYDVLKHGWVYRQVNY